MAASMPRGTHRMVHESPLSAQPVELRCYRPLDTFLGCGRSHVHSSGSRRPYVAAPHGHANLRSSDGERMLMGAKPSSAFEYQHSWTPGRRVATVLDALGGRRATAPTKPVTLCPLTRPFTTAGRGVVGRVADALARDGLAFPVSAVLLAGLRGEDRKAWISSFSQTDLPFCCPSLDIHRPRLPVKAPKTQATGLLSWRPCARASRFRLVAECHVAFTRRGTWPGAWWLPGACPPLCAASL